MRLTLRSQLCLLVAGGLFALALMLAFAQTPPTGRPLLPGPSMPPAVRSIDAAGPLPATGLDGEALPALPADSFMGGRWQQPVTIVNQVGQWFQPYLEAALAAWQAAGVPVDAHLAYGGAPSCEPGEQPAGQVTICLHAMVPPADPPDQGFTHLDVSVTNCAQPACPIQDGFVWVLGSPTVLAPARLRNVLLHELGHIFGLEYSPCTCSVMHIQARVPTITTADTAALAALYSQP